MRTLILSSVLIAAAVAAGFHTQISSSLAMVRNAKAAIFLSDLLQYSTK
jgi:hypothetical protein